MNKDIVKLLINSPVILKMKLVVMNLFIGLIYLMLKFIFPQDGNGKKNI